MYLIPSAAVVLHSIDVSSSFVFFGGIGQVFPSLVLLPCSPNRRCVNVCVSVWVLGEMLCSTKSCLPLPSECIAALNSPQCLAVSHFQCDVFTSRSHETSRGAFSAAAAAGDRRAPTHVEGHTQTFQQRDWKATVRSASGPPVRCPLQSATSGTFVAVALKWFSGQLRRTVFLPFLAEFSPPPGCFSTLNFSRRRGKHRVPFAAPR